MARVRVRHLRSPAEPCICAIVTRLTPATAGRTVRTTRRPVRRRPNRIIDEEAVIRRIRPGRSRVASDRDERQRDGEERRQPTVASRSGFPTGGHRDPDCTRATLLAHHPLLRVAHRLPQPRTGNTHTTSVGHGSTFIESVPGRRDFGLAPPMASCACSPPSPAHASCRRRRASATLSVWSGASAVGSDANATRPAHS